MPWLAAQVFVYSVNATRSKTRNGFAMFELWGDVDFSQRIILAMMVSLFMTALVAVFVAVAFAWAMSYTYDALATFGDLKEELDMVLLWPPALTRVRCRPLCIACFLRRCGHAVDDHQRRHLPCCHDAPPPHPDPRMQYSLFSRVVYTLSTPKAP